MKAGFESSAVGRQQPEGFTPPSLESVAKLFPQLEILDLLGKGGMGAVYKARQPSLDRLVALKILPPGAAGPSGPDAGFAERFTREARALARLSHPNIVAVYDFGQVNGLNYFLMEYVDGLNLRQLEQAGKLTPREVLRIIPQICEALQFAHDEGIVHRDIKPENVLLDKKGRVKIADFGLARILGREPTQHRLTGAGDVMGTPHYMAPEQVERPREVDHRADIYSLGVVFYEMLTGELPLGRFSPPSQKVQVDVRLDEVVLRALEKEPARRYQNVSEVKTDVESIASHPVPQAGGASGKPDPAQQVKWPARGLLAAGILNWVTLPIVLLLFLPYVSRAAFHSRLLTPTWPRVAFVVLLAAIFLFSAFGIYAAVKMSRLECYRTAVAGSVLSMLIAPGNLVGLPVGIWALVTLAQPEVRRAFRQSPASARWWAGWALAAVVLVAALGSTLGLIRRWNHQSASFPAAAVLFHKTFGPGDAPISRDLVRTETGGWMASCTSTQTFRLFEVPLEGLDQCVLIYQARLKSEDLTGRAYLEMWCHFPALGEAFSRGLDNVVEGSTDWASSQTPFFLKRGEQPDNVRLNLVIEGAGKVFIDAIQLNAISN